MRCFSRSAFRSCSTLPLRSSAIFFYVEHRAARCVPGPWPASAMPLPLYHVAHAGRSELRPYASPITNSLMTDVPFVLADGIVRRDAVRGQTLLQPTTFALHAGGRVAITG